METEALERLHSIEHAVHGVTVQRQSMQAQLDETESAAKELSDESYKIIGNLMIKVSAEDVKKELAEKQDLLKKRIQQLEQQEQRLQSEMESLKKEVLDE